MHVHANTHMRTQRQKAKRNIIMKSDTGFSADSETHARAHREDIVLIKNSIYIVVLVRDKYSWEI